MLEPTVHQKGLTRHKATVFRGKEDDGAGQIVGHFVPFAQTSSLAVHVVKLALIGRESELRVA